MPGPPPSPERPSRRRALTVPRPPPPPRTPHSQATNADQPPVQIAKLKLANFRGSKIEKDLANLFRVPGGGIFLWVTLPEAVDTSRLAGPALAAGIAYNPGAEWSTDPDAARHSLRLCFALPGEATIREGIAAFADVCHRETGIPARSANVARR